MGIDKNKKKLIPQLVTTWQIPNACSFKFRSSSSCYPCLLHPLIIRAARAWHHHQLHKSITKVAFPRFMHSEILTQTLETLTSWVRSNPTSAFSSTCSNMAQAQRVTYLVIDYLMAAWSLITCVKLSPYPTCQPTKTLPRSSQAV